jgi:hypothetical protein
MVVVRARMFRYAALVALSLPAFGQGLYPFALDQDRLGGAVDFSFLNHPLTAEDRLVVCGEHFCRAGDGTRVRLYGVNLAFGANFPTADDAPRIARRLRRFGVNLVRLHHMDSSPDARPSDARSILTTGPYPTLNTVSVARLRGFLDALKAEGIYANLNLHVGYQFRPAVDQVPALTAFPTQSKPLHIFYPRMVELQRDYTRQVVEALALRDDPVLGMIEINNESSLVYSWQANNLDPYLAGEYRSALESRWNGFLAGRYSATGKLRAAWGETEADGPQMLGGNWTLEIHSPAQATWQPMTDQGTDVAMVRVTRGGAAVILKQVGFSIATDRSYIAEVEMRADLPAGASRNVYWDLKQDVSPWSTITSRNVAVTNQWQKFTLVMQQPPFAIEKVGRFGLSVEAVDAPIFVRNWSLHTAGRRGLNAGESIEAANVALVESTDIPTQQRLDDYLLFLADRDRAYLARMLQTVRETAGPFVPVAGTQMGYGGLLNLDTHQDLDYQDHHFYVDHYSFPNVAWDGRDWRQQNISAIGGGLTSFIEMAAARQAGRPYTVSEYNQPWPNQQAAEIDATLAAFGAFQDWDAIMHFAYAHGADWEIAVPNGFNVNGDWTKAALFGQSAWLFRSSAIQPGSSPIELPVSLDLRLRAARQRQNSNIRSALGFNTANVFVHPVRVVKDGTIPAPEAARQQPPSPYRSDTGEFTYDAAGKLFLIHAPQAAGAFGYIGNRTVTAGPMEVRLAETARGFAAILLTALDGHAIADSRRLLLSTPGYTLRTQPGSNPPRPQQWINYRGAPDWWTLEPEPGSNKPSGDLNGGIGPVWMERVESYVRIAAAAQAIRVYPLDGAGARLAPLGGDDVQMEDGAFRIHLQGEGQALSPWYEIELE